MQEPKLFMPARCSSLIGLGRLYVLRLAWRSLWTMGQALIDFQ